MRHEISRTDFLKRATGFLNRYLTVYESRFIFLPLSFSSTQIA
ncbi:putative phage protein [Escherichia phage D108]|uniref:Putative phage protein n=1 Tax=Escherichia phage D108 TaxID=665033 RepID=C9DGN9_BPD10|nr:hypothetical protein EP-D108_gp31 [Escherichia phage D108]ACV50290.1 putative phage protein [Escherichia phage D108]